MRNHSISVFLLLTNFIQPDILHIHPGKSRLNDFEAKKQTGREGSSTRGNEFLIFNKTNRQDLKNHLKESHLVPLKAHRILDPMERGSIQQEQKPGKEYKRRSSTLATTIAQKSSLYGEGWKNLRKVKLEQKRCCMPLIHGT